MSLGSVGLVGAIVGETKPKVPAFKPIDVEKEQAAAIAGNVANFSGASKLISRTNEFNADEALKQLRRFNPEYDAISSGINKNILSFIRGEIPDDVSNAVIRRAAEAGIEKGTAGSQFNRKLVARDLGITSFDIMKHGETSAQRWLAQTSSYAKPADIGSMFIAPSDKVALAERDRNAKFQRDYVKNQIDAAHTLRSRMVRSGETASAQMTSILSSL